MTDLTPRPPAPRLLAAYHLGYTMWGTTGKRARQYSLAFYRLWDNTKALHWWQEGHHDAATWLEALCRAALALAEAREGEKA
jgi:hypothetical protein